jgi:DNA-binding transcriptional regulator YhcF (GntR family)
MKRGGYQVILSSDSLKPIYVQIAEWLESEILSGSIGLDEKVWSQYQLAQMFNINPATAAKGLNILADEDILYKKRGLGMFVASDAQERIRTRRRQQTLRQLALDLVQEAMRLGLSNEELTDLVTNIRREIEEGLE